MVRISTMCSVNFSSTGPISRSPAESRTKNSPLSPPINTPPFGRLIVAATFPAFISWKRLLPTVPVSSSKKYKPLSVRIRTRSCDILDISRTCPEMLWPFAAEVLTSLPNSRAMKNLPCALRMMASPRGRDPIKDTLSASGSSLPAVRLVGKNSILCPISRIRNKPFCASMSTPPLGKSCIPSTFPVSIPAETIHEILVRTSGAAQTEGVHTIAAVNSAKHWTRI